MTGGNPFPFQKDPASLKFPPGSNYSFQSPDHRSGYVQQYNFGVQREIVRDVVFDLAYVGNRGRNLPGTYAANQVPFGVDGTIPSNRPYPEWAGIELYETVGRSQYDGLQMKYERRLRNGWYNLTSYTYGRAYSETGGFAAGNTPQVLNDWRAEWAPESQTPRHRLSIANIYQLPIGSGRAIGTGWSGLTDLILGGWQLSTLFTWQTGIPVNITLAASGIDPHTGLAYRFLNRNGGSLRPNLGGTPNTGVDPNDDRFRFLDVNAYQVQPLNTPGNAPRNSAWGPRYANVDISLVKRLRVSETTYFDLRAEAFNAFNWFRLGGSGNTGNPETNLNNANFGRILSAGDPRIMQFALKYQF